jgi:LysM repeat protein
MAGEGSLKKIELVAYEDGGFDTETGSSFSGLINPSSYKKSYSIDYAPRKELGGNSASPSFIKMGQEEISFDLVLDATGIIPPPIGTEITPLAMLIQNLEDTIYTFNGETHQPSFVKIAWGDLSFNGRMTKMSIDYKMFTPGGVSLRANVSLSFIQFVNFDGSTSQGDKQSPDMTHIITIKDGDTLPRLCQQIYGQSDYYLQVASLNELSSFRSLEIGSQIFFPPLK